MVKAALIEAGLTPGRRCHPAAPPDQDGVPAGGRCSVPRTPARCRLRPAQFEEVAETAAPRHGETPPIKHFVLAVHERVPAARPRDVAGRILAWPRHRGGRAMLAAGGLAAVRRRARTSDYDEVRRYRALLKRPSRSSNRDRARDQAACRSNIASPRPSSRSRSFWSRRCSGSTLGHSMSSIQRADREHRGGDLAAARRPQPVGPADRRVRRSADLHRGHQARSARARRWWSATSLGRVVAATDLEPDRRPLSADPADPPSTATGARPRSAAGRARSATWRSSSRTIRWCSPIATPATSASASRSPAWSRSPWSGSPWASS